MSDIPSLDDQARLAVLHFLRRPLVMTCLSPRTVLLTLSLSLSLSLCQYAETTTSESIRPRETPYLLCPFLLLQTRQLIQGSSNHAFSEGVVFFSFF